MDTKVCYKCQVEKEVNFENFYHDKYRNDGFSAMCRICKNNINRNRVRRTKNIVDYENKIKLCSKCKIRKPFAEYLKRPDTLAGIQSECKACYNKRRSLQPSRSPEGNRDKALKAKYGKDFDYDELLKQQNGRCKICEVDIPGWKYKYFQVDHDHSCCSGKKSCGKCVRGLLCHKCNTGLGQLQDSIELMEKAIKYLKDFREKTELNILEN